MAIIRTCTTFEESQIFWKFVSTQHRIRKDAINFFINIKIILWRISPSANLQNCVITKLTKTTNTNWKDIKICALSLSKHRNYYVKFRKKINTPWLLNPAKQKKWQIMLTKMKKKKIKRFLWLDFQCPTWRFEAAWLTINPQPVVDRHYDDAPVSRQNVSLQHGPHAVTVRAAVHEH